MPVGHYFCSLGQINIRLWGTIFACPGQITLGLWVIIYAPAGQATLSVCNIIFLRHIGCDTGQGVPNHQVLSIHGGLHSQTF